MYVKELETGKVIEIRTENGKVIKSDLDNETAKEQITKEIGEIKRIINENNKTYNEKIKTLKKVMKSIEKECGKWTYQEAYEQERDALQLRNQINKEGGEARVRTSGHNSKAFKEGKIWTVEVKAKPKIRGKYKKRTTNGVQ